MASLPLEHRDPEDRDITDDNEADQFLEPGSPELFDDPDDDDLDDLTETEDYLAEDGFDLEFED